MVRQRISDVVISKRVVRLQKFKGIRSLVNELNRTYGYNRFRGIFVNSVYYVVGCGVLFEFQDAEKSMSIVSDIKGRVLSCRLFLEGIEAVGILGRFRCSMTPNCLVIE